MTKGICILMLAVFVAFGCSGSKKENAEATSEKEAKASVQVQSAPASQTLWAYLQSVRPSDVLPDTGEIAEKFGKSDATMEMGFSAGHLQKNQDTYLEFFNDYKHKDKYYRFSKADQEEEMVNVVAWRYFFEKDQNRWTDVLVRKSDGGIVGWEWHENVEPGQETGPPAK